MSKVSQDFPYFEHFLQAPFSVLCCTGSPVLHVFKKFTCQQFFFLLELFKLLGRLLSLCAKFNMFSKILRHFLIQIPRTVTFFSKYPVNSFVLLLSDPGKSNRELMAKMTIIDKLLTITYYN